MSELTSERLKAILAYDRGTGLFTWRVPRSGGVKAGAAAGCSDKDGYVLLTIYNRKYRAHRVAWLYEYGCWPLLEIDHIDGDRKNNRISNLREASRSENQQNMRAPKGSTSPLIGACWDASRGKWIAQIGINGKRHNLGRFDSMQEAHEAYLSAKEKMHPFQTISGRSS